jgi:hypothetical protein
MNTRKEVPHTNASRSQEHSTVYVLRTESMDELLAEGIRRLNETPLENTNRENGSIDIQLDMRAQDTRPQDPSSPSEAKIQKKRTRQVFKKRSDKIENLKALEEYITSKWGRRGSASGSVNKSNL